MVDSLDPLFIARLKVAQGNQPIYRRVTPRSTFRAFFPFHCNPPLHQSPTVRFGSARPFLKPFGSRKSIVPSILTLFLILAQSMFQPALEDTVPRILFLPPPPFTPSSDSLVGNRIIPLSLQTVSMLIENQKAQGIFIKITKHEQIRHKLQTWK